jgi:hypothetical protein
MGYGLPGEITIVFGERNRKIFTVEFEHDEVCITCVDEEANHEDLIVNSFDDIVFIRQWNQDIETFEVVTISPSQWEELIESINSTEGAFIMPRHRKKVP